MPVRDASVWLANLGLRVLALSVMVLFCAITVLLSR